jgi:hypothetical protein
MVKYFKQRARFWKRVHHRDTENTEKTLLFPERETALGKKQSLKSASFSFPASPGKEKQDSLCDLCASNEAGGEIAFLSQSMNHTNCNECVSSPMILRETCESDA